MKAFKVFRELVMLAIAFVVFVAVMNTILPWLEHDVTQDYVCIAPIGGHTEVCGNRR